MNRLETIEDVRCSIYEDIVQDFIKYDSFFVYIVSGNDLQKPNLITLSCNFQISGDTSKAFLYWLRDMYVKRTGREIFFASITSHILLTQKTLLLEMILQKIIEYEKCILLYVTYANEHINTSIFQTDVDDAESSMFSELLYQLYKSYFGN